EARGVGRALVRVRQKAGAVPSGGGEQRPLRDGSSHDIYKVYFTPESLLRELGGGELLFEGSWFLVARSWPGIESTILPKCSPRSMRSCAAAASSSGKTESTTGFRRPVL